MIEIVVNPALTRPVVLPTSIDGKPTVDQLVTWRRMVLAGHIGLRGLGDKAAAKAEGLRWIDEQLQVNGVDPKGIHG